MGTNISNVTANDLDVLTNKILQLNKGFDKAKESYKIELLELTENGKVKVYYEHDFYKNDTPTLEHIIEDIELETLYKRIEKNLYNQNLFKLVSKYIHNPEKSSVDCQVDVMLHGECVYFQIENTKLLSYIRIYDWAIDNV